MIQSTISMVDGVISSPINEFKRTRRLSRTSKSQFHSEKSVGRFYVHFYMYAKLLTSSLAGVSGSLAFFLPIFLAVARQFSKQVGSFLLWKKELQGFATKTPPFSNQNWVAIVIRHLRTQSPTQYHRKEAIPKLFAINITSKWCTYLEVSEILRIENLPDYESFSNVLFFHSTGNVLENRSIWRLSIFSDVFWGIINFVILL